MRNLEEIGKFLKLPEGEVIVLDSAKRRVVVLELNTAAPCQLKLQTGASDLRFLANVEGRETLRFIADGPVTIHADCDDEVWWWTPEVERTATRVDAETFTKIATRRARNPEMERVIQKMQANMERRMAAVMGDVQKVVSGLQAENARLRRDDGAAGDGKAAGMVPDASGGKPPKKERKQADPPAAPVDDAGTGDDGSE